MFRTHHLREPVFRLVLTRRYPTARDDAGATYIGLGDQFDDDRRLVRETASKLRPGMRPAWASRFPSGYFGR